MKPCLHGNSQSHGDLHSLDIIEDKSAATKQGLPKRYSKGRFLGKGGFAKCYEVTDMETKYVLAAKIVAKASIAKPRAMAKLRSEIAIHKSLDHEKVVEFHDHFEDVDYVYITLELCPNQTLNEFMRKRPYKRLSEPEAMFFLYDLIVALKYLHRRRVIHRDLKLGNLFLDAEVRLKVGDFGLAAQLEHDGEKKRTICGTPNYIAPEILDGKHGHSYEVDIWSLGVILYTMTIGRPPFETSDVKTTYRRIRHNQYTFPETVNLTTAIKDLVSTILRTDPRARPQLEEIVASSWFHGTPLPPPTPASICSFSVSPRVLPLSGSSMRSETPERGVADFARIDSPAPRFPLRERSPCSIPTPSSTAVYQPHRGSAAPLLPTGRQLLTPHGSYQGSLTPGRASPSTFGTGRPPLAYWANDENAMPLHANLDLIQPGVHESCEQQKLPSTSASPRGLPARPQDPPMAHTASGGSRVGSTASSPQCSPAYSVPLVPLRVALSRDQSPILRVACAQTGVNGISALPSARLTNSIGRSTTCSPTQDAILSSVCRLPSGGGQMLDSHRFGGADPAAMSSSQTGTPATLASTRSVSSLLSSRPRIACDSPCLQRVQVKQPDQSPVGARREIEGIDLKGLPLAASPVSSSRQVLSERRHERSSSTPALSHDGLRRNGTESARVADRLGTPPTGTPRLTTRGVDVHGRSPVQRSAAPRFQLNSVPLSQVMPSSMMPELWVTKWVDYSSKYGVGYILSDLSLGVYFNDSTKIILVPDGRHFDYITRRSQDKPEMRSTHTFDDFPEDLKKKVTLLRHFRNLILTESTDKKDGATTGESKMPPAQRCVVAPYGPGQAPHVKKWTHNKYATLFQLSNKNVQVIFFDGTEAVLSSKSNTVAYIDKKGKIGCFPYSSSMESSNPELAKRLRYIKDIVTNMMGSRS